MLMWVAAGDTQPRGSTFVDWVPLIAAILVLLGVFITAAVARVNARKPWYENLETLIKVHKDWPEGVPGKETIEQAIADMLAGIRVDTDRAGQEGATKAELEAEEHARRQIERPLGLRIFQLIATGVGIAFTVHSVHPPLSGPIPSTSYAFLGVGFLYLIVKEVQRANKSALEREEVPPTQKILNAVKKLRNG